MPRARRILMWTPFGVAALAWPLTLFASIYSQSTTTGWCLSRGVLRIYLGFGADGMPYADTHTLSWKLPPSHLGDPAEVIRQWGASCAPPWRREFENEPIAVTEALGLVRPRFARLKQPQTTWITLPFWTISFPGAALAVFYHCRTHRSRLGHCRCGYDLTGIPAGQPCPECGCVQTC